MNVKNKLISVAKNKIDSDKNKKVAIYVSPKGLNVVAITNTDTPYVSPDFYFDTVENVNSLKSVNHGKSANSVNSVKSVNSAESVKSVKTRVLRVLTS